MTDPRLEKLAWAIIGAILGSLATMIYLSL